MHIIFAALLILMLPAMATAQSGGRLAPGRPAMPSIMWPQPPIGFPAPVVAPVPGLPPLIDGQPPLRDSSQRADRRRDPYLPPPAVYLVPGYGYGFDPSPFWPLGTPVSPVGNATGYFLDERSNYPEDEPLTGTLRIQVEPADETQLYVDGLFVGMLGDVDSEVTLEAGPHSVEMRAPGYEPLEFDASIIPDRSITYRGALKPFDVPTSPGPEVQPVPETVPRTPTTLYFIPGCYLGNVPPKDAGLPATCDLSRATTFKR